jgi:cell division protein FtsL
MKGKFFLIIIIFTFITVLIWVAVDIVHSQQKTQITPEIQTLLEPVNPNLDKELINDL